MSAHLSKEIIDCTQAGEFVLSAFEVEGPRVAAEFLGETRPYLEDGDAEPRPDGFLVAVMRRLRAAIDHLVETDRAVANAMGFESQLRGRHREAKRQLAFQIVALRRLVLAHYEEPDMDNLALQPVNVRDAPTIQCRAELVGQRFEAENLVKMLGRPRFEQPIDLGPYVNEIHTRAAELMALSEEINQAHRATDCARRARTNAKQAYDRVFLRGARMFEDMCRFAGLDALAAKIRRRQRRRAVDEDVSSDDVTAQAPDPDTLSPAETSFSKQDSRDDVAPWQEAIPAPTEPAGGRDSDLRPGAAARGPSESEDLVHLSVAPITWSLL